MGCLLYYTGSPQHRLARMLDLTRRDEAKQRNGVSMPSCVGDGRVAFCQLIAEGDEVMNDAIGRLGIGALLTKVY